VRETEAELTWMQELLDATFARANPHLLAIVTPERRLNARQMAAYLQGTKHVAFGTVTAKGEPRVAPLDGVFVHGRFTLSSSERSARVRNLRRNPACSGAHMVGDEVAVVANGTAEFLVPGRADHDEVHAVWTELYGSDPYTWDDDVVLWRLEPVSMWAYAPRATEFAER
jgi:uncharacterized pyridoxamine 5'-phosphate oxidase family protein